MKVILDSNLILKILLNCDNNNSQYFESFWKIISSPSKMQIYMTRYGLDKIYSLTSMSKSLKEAESLVSDLESIFVVCEGSSSIFENARHRDSEISEALDYECGWEMDVDAIITESPRKYVRDILPVWTVEQFTNRCKLDESLSIPYFPPKSQQLFLPWAGEKAPSTYMIRNTIPIIKKALEILKSEGGQGLAPKRSSFQTRTLGENY